MRRRRHAHFLSHGLCIRVHIAEKALLFLSSVRRGCRLLFLFSSCVDAPRRHALNRAGCFSRASPRPCSRFCRALGGSNRQVPGLVSASEHAWRRILYRRQVFFFRRTRRARPPLGAALRAFATSSHAHIRRRVGTHPESPRFKGCRTASHGESWELFPVGLAAGECERGRGGEVRAGPTTW